MSERWEGRGCCAGLVYVVHTDEQVDHTYEQGSPQLGWLHRLQTLDHKTLFHLHCRHMFEVLVLN